MSLSLKEVLFKFAVSELAKPTCSHVVDYLKNEMQSSNSKVIAAALGASLIPTPSNLEGNFIKICRKESSLGRYFSITSESLELLVQDVGVAMKGERCPYISLQEGILFVTWILSQIEDSKPPMELVEPSVTLRYLGKIIRALAAVSSERISWPSQSQSHEIVDAFDKLYGFPGVIGVLATSKLPILMPEDIKSEISVNMEDFYDNMFDCPTVTLQVVVDHREELHDVCVGLPGSWSPNKVLRSSRLYSRLIGSDTQDICLLITEGYHLIAGCEYYHLPTLITPYDLQVTGASQTQLSFNRMHAEALRSGITALSNFISKFPRLKSLNSVENWNPLRKEFHLGDDVCHSAATVTLAACVLHNSSLE